MLTSLTLAYFAQDRTGDSLFEGDEPEAPAPESPFGERAREAEGAAPAARSRRCPRRPPAAGAGAPRRRRPPTRSRSAAKQAACYSARPPVRQWRNWQTHQLEGLAGAIPWRFESSLPHQL